jgi:DNA-binding PadR family transcriptional regulator
MQFVILGLLLIERMSLYDLHKQFTAGLGLFYGASFGSIQRALRQLIDAGMVTVTDDPSSARRRKIHAVTDEGRRAWESWMREPIGGSNAETALLAKVYLLGVLPADDDRAAVLSTLRSNVDTARDELNELARALDAQEIPAEYATIFSYQRATLDYGLRTHELALRWLDDLTERG